MKTFNKFLVTIGALALTCSLWLALKPGAPPPPPQEAKKLAVPAKPLNPGFTQVPASPVIAAPSKPVDAPRPDYGKTPETPKELLANPQGQSNLEALKKPQAFPERLSPMISGKAFDAARWATDASYKAEYLAAAEPSRAFAAAKDPKAPSLQRLSELNPIVAHGQKIILQIKASPGAPVSALSPNLNRFVESGLTACTVVADADGVASFTMEGVPGTIAGTDVICASPLCSGTVIFKVETVQADPQSE